MKLELAVKARPWEMRSMRLTTVNEESRLFDDIQPIYQLLVDARTRRFPENGVRVDLAELFAADGLGHE